ncbi:Anaphase-promoting complex subunit cut9 [Vanrija pseudolonga]|uniref:Anaphase-promoting complex subunit cut9 n=1 Tax=Vanrija pseudolonga TaxID=143232 RepID=A0AAF1BJ86_9TREE|nr:Anaphase-promoting complex subunit cut9 [Vanrija pseudolonga]
MSTQTPFGNGVAYTPQNAPPLRRGNGLGSAGRPSLSASFSLNPADVSGISDMSAPSSLRGRAVFLSSAEQGHLGMGQVSPRVRPSLYTSRAGPSNGPARLVPAETRHTRSRSRLSEVMDEDGLGTSGDEFDDVEHWGMIDSMRQWRQDAMLQHLYQTAAFWGDKLFSWTGDVDDGFWLAQSYFLQGNYLKAERLLTDNQLPPASAAQKGKGKGRGGDLLDDEDEAAPAPIRLIEKALPCRFLAVQCLIHQDKHAEALEMVGESNAFRDDRINPRPAPDELKLHSSMCYLRGILHLRLSSLQRAKECFIEALVIDPKNYEAFRELVEGQMMSSEEEWEFINNLAYRDHLQPDAAAFVRLMYLSKLRKDSHVTEIAAVRRELAASYGLGDNCDVMVGEAEELFARYKWEECYVVTSKILERVPGHVGALPLHLACMHHLPRLRSSLYMLAHDLVDQNPHAATSWYAVGLWYFTGRRWADARRYFSKANLIDSRFAPAWVAFGHSFAWEGEHEQAITAYSTTSRLFSGSHLPLLFIGQEQLQLSQSALAEEYFLSAAAIHPSDPLLLHELGVAAYNRDDYANAIDYFQRAISGAGDMQGVAQTWAVTHCNLGHALRVEGRYPEARAAYQACIRLDPTNATAYASQAMLSQLEGDVRTAIRLYHAALALSPQDPMATVLLEMALREQVEVLDPTTLPGLPAAIAQRDLDPFSVPKGNPAFGPLPIEIDPATLSDAGGDTTNMSFSQAELDVPAVTPRARSAELDPDTSVSLRTRSHVSATPGEESSWMEIEED